MPQKEHSNTYYGLNKKQFSEFLTHDKRYLEISCSFGGVLKKVADFGVDV